MHSRVSTDDNNVQLLYNNVSKEGRRKDFESLHHEEVIHVLVNMFSLMKTLFSVNIYQNITWYALILTVVWFYVFIKTFFFQC